MDDATRTRWRTVDALFAEALDRPASEQAAFLRAACRHDPDLYDEVATLLAQETEAEAAIGEHAEDFVAPLLPRLQRTLSEDGDLAAGSRIGPYRIVRSVGRGGMGNVYLAERADGTFRKHVALKLVRRGRDTDDLLDRFRQERQLLAGLDHPHIARLLDGGSDDGRPYLVMEYVEGRPITAYADAERLPVEARLALFEQVCEAVTYAHRALVVHRDLKPNNVLVTDDGAVKLLDFGIAKLLDPAAEPALPATQEGVRLLTPEYAAPEQIRGEAVGTTADVYALGVLLYHLLTGRRPIDTGGLGPLAREHALLSAEPMPPATAPTEEAAAARGRSRAQLQRQLRGDLATILMKALAKAPDRRYGSVEALSEDLRRYRSGLPIHARPAGRLYRARRFVARHRMGVTAGTLAAVLLVAAVTLLTLSQHSLTLQRDRAERELTAKQEVTDFLTSLFEGANPDLAQGDTLTVFDLLARGMERTETELAAQPELQALLSQVIGRLYMQLGSTEQARTLAEQALAIYTAADPADLRTAEASTLMGTISLRAGRFAEADTFFHRALEIQERLLLRTDPAVTRTRINAGVAKLLLGDYAAADALLGPASDPAMLEIDEDPETASFLLNSVGLYRYHQGDYATAADHFARALELRRQLYGARHPRLTPVLNNLGGALLEMGDPAAAEPLFHEALLIERAVYGAAYPNSAHKLNNLANAMALQGRLPEALSYTEEAVRLYRAHFDDHPNLATALSLLGLIRRELGQLAPAEAALLEALRMHEAALGPRHAHTARALYELGLLAFEQGDPQAGVVRLREALAIQEHTLPEGHSQRTATEHALATLAEPGLRVSSWTD